MFAKSLTAFFSKLCFLNWCPRFRPVYLADLPTYFLNVQKTPGYGMTHDHYCKLIFNNVMTQLFTKNKRKKRKKMKSCTVCLFMKIFFWSRVMSHSYVLQNKICFVCFGSSTMEKSWAPLLNMASYGPLYLRRILTKINNLDFFILSVTCTKTYKNILTTE